MSDGPQVREVTGSSPAWQVAAGAILSTFDSRAQVILRDRVLAVGRRVRTLQEIGTQFEISRERVRQIELAARKDILGLVGNPNAELRMISGRIRDELGPIFTTEDLASTLEVEVDAASLSAEIGLALFLAGPYELSSDYFVKQGFSDELKRLAAQIGASGSSLKDVRSALHALGVPESRQLRVIDDLVGIRMIAGHVVAWNGSLADKAATVLELRQRLMTVDEIHGAIGEGGLNTLKNYLASDTRFQRRGPHTWGLFDWGGESYESIAVEMTDELKQSSNGMPVTRLKRLLAEKFGINPASVEIMSATHPRFVREGVWVRLRPSNEPYIPDSAIEEDPDCVVIAGAWAWRHTVNHDTLRGSGLPVPEPFAVHLGTLPGGRRELVSDQGTIRVSWPAQTPSIGSIRRVAEAHNSDKGDLLFVSADGNRLEFTIARLAELQHHYVVDQLKARLGQRAVEGPWLRACAVALGLPQHARPAEIEQLLEARGDREDLRLFRSALRTTNEQ